MRGIPIVVFGPTFLVFSLLASSKAHPNEQISDNVEAESNPRLTEEERFEPRVSRAKSHTAGVTEDRLKADGFLKDNHPQSSLEHDLTNKLQAIYERYYELTDKLQQAEGHSSELTKQLMQTKLDLANYKVYKNDLLKRLKKTEMYLTVLLKKSQYHIEEHEVDLNHVVNEALAKKSSSVGEAKNKQDAESRSVAVTNGNVKEDVNEEPPNNQAQVRLYTTRIAEPHLDTNPTAASVEAGDVEKAIDTESESDIPSTETSGTTATEVLDSQRNQTINNGTTNEDVLAQIAFNFLRKKPTKPKTPDGPTLRGGFFDRVPEGAAKLPSGPIEKNVTVVLRGASKRKDSKGASLADWGFGPGIGNMGFKIFESDSEDHHHPNIQYRRGEPGSAGTPGVPGTPGSSGPAGPAGKDGTVGLAGGAGQKGEPGMGVAGVNGVNGATGVQGAPGFPGPSGAPGVNGVQGVKGSRGVQGPMGAKGIKGIVGDAG